MIDPSAVNTVLDSCFLCGFDFVDKKRKRSITGEFAEIFVNEAGSQTVKSSCHCWQSSGQGTCVKVCTISELQLSVNKCKLHLSTDKTVHSLMFV